MQLTIDYAPRGVTSLEWGCINPTLHSSTRESYTFLKNMKTVLHCMNLLFKRNARASGERWRKSVHFPGPKFGNFPELDTQVLNFIRELRNNACAVSHDKVEVKAQEIDCSMKIPLTQFKPSCVWVVQFMRQENLSLRCRTTLTQKLPKDFSEKVLQFQSFVIRHRKPIIIASKSAHFISNSLYHPSQIGNTDETPVFFDMTQSITTCPKGASSVTVGTTRNEKLCCTWEAFVSYFSKNAVEDRIEVEKSILTALQNPLIKAFFLFLAFILPTVINLNSYYQGTEYRLHLLISLVGDKMKMIVKYFMKPQYVLNTPIEKINPADNCQFLDISKIYLGARVEAIIMGSDKGRVPERGLAILSPDILSIMPLAINVPNVIEE
ncbi:hypothetical protein PR048_002063 [Dryococelus australis]|uniref:HTH CENPB-type domain-containing protein n=1 Tax=Dryococelus australis TaxID=614101 RepID=A0ABQ9IJ58_9NEOP|nr:hypothetical protein PR048_002063 [Dryococelus australis]